MNARVPTLPTPTTLRAASTIWNRSSRWRRSAGRVAGRRGNRHDRRHNIVRGQSERSGQLTQRHDDRWLAHDPVLPIGHLAELGQRLQTVTGVGLLAGFLRPRRAHWPAWRPPRLSWPSAWPSSSWLPSPLSRSRPPRRDRGYQLVLIQAGVPDVHRRQLGQRCHRLPVGPHRRERRRAGVFLGEPVMAGRDGEAGRHPLHVILKRPGQGFVEVVEIGQRPALGGGERLRRSSTGGHRRTAARPGGHRGVLQVPAMIVAAPR